MRARRLSARRAREWSSEALDVLDTRGQAAVISVLVYGRNDSHGYNLHRRVALSLNCFAEVLTDPDDEILFVDYNTADELPTLVEAIADTLTEACLDRLRVLRVPAAIHERRFGGRTHLSVLEPVARNVGARRANTANRWLLSTNSDMILLPRSDRSLSEICGDLPDAYYGLPRFELPEWLWEQLPRTDPVRAMAEIRQLAPSRALDEVTLSYEWARFDAPGDFQLILRDDLCAVDGFNEEMMLGYHVDSNLARRMYVRRGAIESLQDQLAGYHCNHLRTPTALDVRVAGGDLDRFCFSVNEAELPGQRQTWGLSETTVHEVRVRRGGDDHLAAAVVASSPGGPGERTSSNVSRLTGQELTYDSVHVAPFIADAFAVSPPGTKIAYLGANPVLKQLLESLVARLSLGSQLLTPGLDDPSALELLARTADVVVVDFGVDSALAGELVAATSEVPWPILPSGIGLVFSAFEHLVELQRSRLNDGGHPHRFVLVNSGQRFINDYVSAQMDRRNTTHHSRVRQAIAKTNFDQDANATTSRAHTLIHWIARHELYPGRLHIEAGQTFELFDLPVYRGFGDGWSYPEEAGIWTEGQRSTLALSFDRVDGNDYRVLLEVRSVCVAIGDSLRADLLVNDHHVSTRNWVRGESDPTWRVDLTGIAAADGVIDLTVFVDEPRSPVDAGWPADDRLLGLLIGAIRIEQVVSPGREGSTSSLRQRLRRV